MFDPTICTEEHRIEGVAPERARAMHMMLELTYMQGRQHEIKTDNLFVGHYAIPTKHVLASIDSWSDGYTWNHPRLRTLAIAIDALEYKNFAAELSSYEESGL